VAGGGETRGRDAAEVPESEDADLHARESSSHGFAWR
jgi:hypothetical protein